MLANKRTSASYRLLAPLLIVSTVITHPVTAAAEPEAEATAIERAFDSCGYTFKDLKKLNDHFGRTADVDSSKDDLSFSAEAVRLGNVLMAQAQTQADKTVAANTCAVISDFLLGYVASELMRYQGPEARAEFKIIQELWTGYRDRYARLIATQHTEGATASMIKSTTRQRVTLMRLAELEVLLRDYREQHTPYYADLDPSLKMDVPDPRQVLASLQDGLYERLHLTPEELSLTKVKKEYVETYHEEIEPRLRDIAGNINASAIHWIDIDWDGVPELVCWTEGVSLRAWGAHEYLFIISVPKTGKPEILHAKKLDEGLSRGYRSYRHVRFTSRPNKDAGTNDCLAGLLTYAAYGGSGSTFYNIEIWYNRYSDEIELNEFTTSFPVMVDILQSWR